MLRFSSLAPLTLAAICLQTASTSSSAQSPDAPQTLPEVVVTGKADDLFGVAPSASSGTASSADLAARPYLRRGEILETIPGVIITQHAGGGKANQYFLRGFNLDHGTDFAISVDGMPVNMRTHAHGQGYADLNFLIPELIENVTYEKGVYSARNGDLSSAGSADFQLFNALPLGIASVTWGEHNYWRGLIADTLDLAENRKLTLALEYNSYDGPWVLPEEFQRWNGLIRYFHGDAENHWAATLMGYHGKWQSSDQIPRRAIDDGRIPRLGFVDPTTGGDSQRYSLNVEFLRTDGSDVWRGNAYAFYYDLNLFSNFTYFLDDPLRGDQFEQAEQRWVLGGELVRDWKDRDLLGAKTRVSLGLQTRHDIIDPIGLYKTDRRERFRTVREDSVYEGSIGLFAEAEMRWTDWLRTTIGVRGDAFLFDVSSNNPRNSGEELSGLVSPKFGAVLGPWKETEFYLNFGTGFHSNDARGVNNTVDPESGDPIPPVDPLVRTIGAEIGLRSKIIPTLTFTAAAWWLESDSELVYVGDAGTNEAGPGSNRYGVEIAAYWRPVDWFTLDAEFAATHARFRDAGEFDHIPSSIPWMFSGGVTVGKEEGPFASLRARAFARRPLVEDNSVRGENSFQVNGQIGYRRKDWEVAVECLNLLDREDNDIEYFYTSRLQGEPAEGIEDIHLHPNEPRMFRLRATHRF
jgi:hypothetical protein